METGKTRTMKGLDTGRGPRDEKEPQVEDDRLGGEARKQGIAAWKG